MVRAGLEAVLGATEGIMLVGEAATGEEAIDLTGRLRPDVVVMDLSLGEGMNGAEATRAIRSHPGAPQVLILTTYDSDADILSAVESGATGYLLKDSDPTELVRAIAGAARGETVLSPPVAGRLVARMRGPAVALSPREAEIVRLVAEGRSNHELARLLFITEATVKSHLLHVFTKLGVENRTAAVARARELGILRGTGR